MLDGSGISGLLVGYAFMAASSLSTLLALFWAWRRGLLSQSEALGQKMVEDEEYDQQS